jgi:protein-disulfide isomerase
LALPLLANATPPPDLEQQVLDIIKRNPQVILDAVSAYQSQNAIEQRRNELQANLRHPVEVNTEGAPVRGPLDAPLTLIEFSDFQCPFCARAETTIATLRTKYKGKLRLVHLHLPLPMHPQAKAAATAAWAAGKQGKFWEYHDRLFALNGQILSSSFDKIARELKLDLKRFDKDRKSTEAILRIDSDSKQAAELGIDGTPTFVLNGVVLRGALPLEDFEEVIKMLEAQPATLNR